MYVIQMHMLTTRFSYFPIHHGVRLLKGVLSSHVLLLGCLLGAIGVPAAHALPADTYASASVLAEGRWTRVKVSEAGLQFISNSALKSMGFTDPSKVRVYGYGGQMLPETLNASLRDDLPMVGTLHADNGLYFFAVDYFSWDTLSAGNKGMKYAHTINPYAETSYYFLSDREAGNDTPETRDCSELRAGNNFTEFTQRLVYEKDLASPANTGRLLLGEDFRGTASRSFPFNLTDYATGDPKMLVAFGSYTSGGAAQLKFTANGTEIDDSSVASLSAVTSKEGFLRYGSFLRSVPAGLISGDKLNIGIAYQSQATIHTARLDYIELEYQRKLRLHDGELHFYEILNGTATFNIDGCNTSTVIWDVTDPVKPVRVNFKLDGSTARFTDTATGLKEYVAFNPGSVRRAPTTAGQIANQNIHGLPMPDMVIISPAQYMQAANTVADMHRRVDGMTVHVLAPEAIYNEFASGTADVTAFRKMLKMWYDRAAEEGVPYPRYCMIMGRPTYDNKAVTPSVAKAGYVRVPIWGSPTGWDQSSSYTTDDYIGMLDDTGTTFSIGPGKIHVAIGRWPVKSADEANIMARKLVEYVENPVLGAWRNNVMLIADDQDNAAHLNQSEWVYKGLRSTGNGANFLYDRLYLDSYPLSYTGTGAGYPEAKEHMLKKINEGVSFISYIGHANPKSWTHEGLLNWTDITNMNNPHAPFLYAATCEFLRWDDDAVSGAEIMWLYPSAGFIGMICPSRSVYIDQNGALSKTLSNFVYSRDKDGGAARVGDIYINAKNGFGATTSNRLKFCLLADPAMRVVSPDFNIKVESINNIELATAEELPIIGARSRVTVEGYVADREGNICSDFEGILEVALFDAEKVITTYGNGKNGTVTDYNDRKTRLYNGRVNVKEGRWNLTLLMPSEIEHNFTPALLSMYASSNDGREANGACEQFYVYGFDSEAAPDETGPEITDFYLNTASFTDGTRVNSTPVVFATFTDASGINLSKAGIGHNMLIVVDGNIYHGDVADSYVPDAEDPTKGSIKYALPEVTPGEHTLTLTVWDNANNSSSASLAFNVGVGLPPSIVDLSASATPAVTSTVFTLTTDRPMSTMTCLWEVFDLNGKRLWSKRTDTSTDIDSRLQTEWNLTDENGRRVARGIYIYRVTLSTPEGYTSRASRRIAVSGSE